MTNDVSCCSFIDSSDSSRVDGIFAKNPYHTFSIYSHDYVSLISFSCCMYIPNGSHTIKIDCLYRLLSFPQIFFKIGPWFSSIFITIHHASNLTKPLDWIAVVWKLWAVHMVEIARTFAKRYLQSACKYFSGCRIFHNVYLRLYMFACVLT